MPLMPDHPKTMTCMEVWGGNALASNSVSISGLDAWVYCKPYASAESGGDIYYLSSCATGRITRLLVADVSGHGSAVTDTASALQNLMRRYVNHLDQQSFVRSMNQQFTRLSTAGPGGGFATAVVSTFFAPTNSLSLCNAGHPSPLLYRRQPNGQGVWSLLQRTESAADGISNIPLGIDGASDYHQIALELEPTDLVLCYSDSLIEVHTGGSDSAELLGEQGLLQILQQLPSPTPDTLIPALLEKLRSLAPGNLEEDDVTILLFRPNTSRPRAGFFQRAFAPLRVLVASIMSLFPNHGPAPLPEISAANLLGINPKRPKR
jgi:sigma-B regulation protein RsbU (phosphoserine phosphatase)